MLVDNWEHIKKKAVELLSGITSQLDISDHYLQHDREFEQKALEKMQEREKQQEQEIEKQKKISDYNRQRELA